MQALRGAFFRPNIVFLRMPDDPDREADYRHIIAEADREEVGTLLFAPHPRAALGQCQTINVWIRDRSPDFEEIRHRIDTTDSTCMFVRDSGRESALA